MKVKILIILLFSCSNYLFSQIENEDLVKAYVSAVDNVFSEIDPDKITTGLLIERSVPEISIENYNGTDTSHVCSSDTWVKAYKQLYLAHLNLEEFGYNEEILGDNLLKNVVSEDIPIAILNYNYNKFSNKAIINGLIEINSESNKIIDLTGSNATPFETKNCFIVAPMQSQVKLGSHNFVVNENLFYSNVAQKFDYLEIDFDDGNGFIKTYVGASEYITYLLSGIKNVTTRAKINGFTYISNSLLEVVDEAISTKSTSAMSTFDVMTPDYGPFDFVSNGITAEYGIYYRCNGDGTIRKPYIIVSGIDPSDINRVQDEAESILVYFPAPPHYVDSYDEKVNLYRVANKDGYLDKLRDSGYDIIVYRSKESLESIIDNGLNLVQFINKINNEKTSDNELIIAGASMGGLITRYALTYMEHNNIDHQTKLFISVDSPQNGANVPLGFQHLIQYLNSDLYGLFSLIGKLKDAKEKGLDCDAAKEMLLYHYTVTSGNSAGASDKRTAYLNNLYSIGNFPKNCRNIALSLGSGNGTTQGFNPGDMLLKKNRGSIFPDPNAPIPITVGTKFVMEFEVKAVPDHASSEIYSQHLGAELCIKVDPCPGPTSCPREVCVDLPELSSSRSVTVNNTVPIDNAPGSVQNLHNTMAFGGGKEVMNFPIKDLLSLLGLISYDEHPDNFIPSYSALGLNSVSAHTNIKSYFNSNPNVIRVNDNQYLNIGGSAISYFDMMYIENINDNHIYDENKEGVFSPNMLSMMNLETAPDKLYIEDKSITNGQSIELEARNELILGNNVNSDAYNNGDVVVESGGNLVLTANEKVLIMPGFYAKSGSNVHISNDGPNYCATGTTMSTAIQKGLIDKSTSSNLQQKSTQSQDTDLFKIVEDYSKPVIIYPNPTNGIVYISSNKKQNTVAVFEMNGQEIIRRKFIKSLVLDLTEYAAGAYIIKISQVDGKEIVEQIILK